MARVVEALSGLLALVVKRNWRARAPEGGLTDQDVEEGDELVLFEAHAAGCERCRLMVRRDREALALAAPEMDPSPDFKAGLMQRAAEELTGSSATAATEPIPLRPPPNVIPLWRRSPWISVLAAVFVIALVSVGAFSYQN